MSQKKPYEFCQEPPSRECVDLLYRLLDVINPELQGTSMRVIQETILNVTSAILAISAHDTEDRITLYRMASDYFAMLASMRADA